MSPPRPATHVEVLIVGGGMVGASLAIALGECGVGAMLVEAIAPGEGQPSFDDRTTALGNASRRIFEGLGCWELLASRAAAIRTIHVSDSGRFGFARLVAEEQGVDAFGYVISNRVIGSVLWERLRQLPTIELRVPARPQDLVVDANGVSVTLIGESGIAETVSARLVVAADGANSVVRAAAGIDAEVVDYQQVAVIANVTADRPNTGVAYERFTDSGPLAVLPLFDGGYGVIWCCRPEVAPRLLGLDEPGYLRELQDRFGWRAGRFVRAGARASYPLKLSRASAAIGERTVLIGNAAQALHPVAGQGFNLGLRDAAMLAELIGAGVADAGDPALLRKFAHWRGADRDGVTRFTDGLVRLFADSRPGVGFARNLGLLMFDLAPPAKRALARISAGFAGPAPRLSRGAPLRTGRAHAGTESTLPRPADV